MQGMGIPGFKHNSNSCTWESSYNVFNLLIVSTSIFHHLASSYGLDQIFYPLRTWPGRNVEKTVTGFVGDWKKESLFHRKFQNELPLLSFHIKSSLSSTRGKGHATLRNSVRYLARWDKLMSWETESVNKQQFSWNTTAVDLDKLINIEKYKIQRTFWVNTMQRSCHFFREIPLNHFFAH